MTLGDRVWTGDDGRARAPGPRRQLRAPAGPHGPAGPQSHERRQAVLARARDGVLSIRRLSATTRSSRSTRPTPRSRSSAPASTGSTSTTTATRASRSGAAAPIATAGGGQVALAAGEELDIDGLDAPRYEVVAPAARPTAGTAGSSSATSASPQARSYTYVTADIAGVEDLDQHGRWQQIPDYGLGLVARRRRGRLGPLSHRPLDLAGPVGLDLGRGRAVGMGARTTMDAGRTVERALVLGAGRPGGSRRRLLAGPRRVRRRHGRIRRWFPLAPRDPYYAWWRRGPTVNVTNVTYVNRTYVTVVNQTTFVSGRGRGRDVVRDRNVIRSVESAPVLRGPVPVVPTRAVVAHDDAGGARREAAGRGFAPRRDARGAASPAAAIRREGSRSSARRAALPSPPATPRVFRRRRTERSAARRGPRLPPRVASRSRREERRSAPRRPPGPLERSNPPRRARRCRSARRRRPASRDLDAAGTPRPTGRLGSRRAEELAERAPAVCPGPFTNGRSRPRRLSARASQPADRKLNRPTPASDAQPTRPTEAAEEGRQEMIEKKRCRSPSERYTITYQMTYANIQS